MHAFASATAHSPVRRSLSVLDSVQIAQPCPAQWEAMRPVGGQTFERVRHCESCNLRVYNLSAMARADAEALLRASEGRLCVRLYRRHDGTVLTADCSYFRRAVDATSAAARRVGWLLACGFAAVIGCNVWAAGLVRERRNPGQANIVQSGMDQLAQVRPIAWLLQKMRPLPPVAGMVPAPLGSPAPAPPVGMWVAGGRGPIEMGDVIQGEMSAPTPPVPAVDPNRWLQIDEPRRPPV